MKTTVTQATSQPKEPTYPAIFRAVDSGLIVLVIDSSPAWEKLTDVTINFKS